MDKIRAFKASLYENMVNGLLSKEDYAALKGRYTEDEQRLQDAVAALTVQRDNALDGRAEQLRWMEHFEQFAGLEALDRRTVVGLLHHIRVNSKTELDIRFQYQAEYEQALSLLHEEAIA